MNIKRLVFSPIEVNTYIISDKNGDCAIIDAGCYNESEFGMLKDYISNNNLNPVKLLNTHLHLDHIFGNRFIKKEYGLLTNANEEEKENLISSPLHAEMFGLEMPEPPEIGTFIKHGDIITIGDISLECLFVPGHSAGSIAYYSREHSVVFTGDALFAGGIGRTDLPGGNHETLLKNIREVLLALDGHTTVYPGHGSHTTIEYERSNNPFLT